MASITLAGGGGSGATAAALEGGGPGGGVGSGGGVAGVGAEDAQGKRARHLGDNILLTAGGCASNKEMFEVTDARGQRQMLRFRYE